MSFISPGQTLKRVRAQLNITQNELEEAGISRNFISMFESGRRKLSKKTGSKIIDILKNVANEKGIDVETNLEYLYVSPENAAKAYCANKLNSKSDLSEINEVIDLCKEYNFGDMLRQATIAKANILYSETKYKEAFYCYQEALEMSIRVNEICELSMLYNKLGKCKFKLLSYEEALIFFQKSYQNSISCEDILNKKNSLFNMVLSYKKIDMMDDALISIDKYIAMIDKEEYMEEYVNACILKANCYMSISEYDQALRLYKDIENIKLNESSSILGFIYNNMGVVYLNLDRIDDSLFYFEKAEEIRRKENNSNLAYTLLDKSRAYVKKDLIDKAAELLERGIEIAANLNNVFCVIRACSLLEEIYFNKNNLELLESTYIRMLKALESTEDKHKINVILSKLALLNINKGNIEKGKLYLEASIESREVTL